MRLKLGPNDAQGLMMPARAAGLAGGNGFDNAEKAAGSAPADAAVAAQSHRTVTSAG